MTLSVETWPCYNIISDLGQVGTNHLFCVACHQPGISMRLMLYGNPYNPSTIETIEPDARMGFEKVTSVLLSKTVNVSMLFNLSLLLCVRTYFFAESVLPEWNSITK